MKSSKKLTVAEFLTKKIDESGLSQKDIAKKIGYDNANIIKMFKQGLTKIPFSAVRPISSALDIDPAYFLRLLMSEYIPETYLAIEDCLGAWILSENETYIIEAYRSITRDTNPEVMVLNDMRIFAVAVPESVGN